MYIKILNIRHYNPNKKYQKYLFKFIIILYKIFSLYFNNVSNKAFA